MQAELEVGLGHAFEPMDTAAGDDFAKLARRPAAVAGLAPLPPVQSASPGVVVATFHGFDLLDQPIVVGVPNLPGLQVLARTTVALRREMIGASVVLTFENGDPGLPIILGVLQQTAAMPPSAPAVSAQVDDERVVISAEREIVLQCGDASITLTRAGKVLIKGNYILSRSTGYNKIKGAAIDIN